MRIPPRRIATAKPAVVSDSIEYVRRASDDSLVWVAREGTEAAPSCIHCADAPCLRFTLADIESASYAMTFDRNPAVCPFGAIQFDRESGTPKIGDGCCGCGLCVGRCPVGAIAIKGGRATVASEGDGILVADDEADHLASRNRIAQLVYGSIESNRVDWPARRLAVEATLAAVDHSTGRGTMGLLVRNLLLVAGVPAKLGVQGDTNSRLDLTFDMDGYTALAELEQNPDLLDSTRRLLADVATARARHGLVADSILPVIVCRALPNKRTDFYRLADDARGVLGLTIVTLPLATLLLLVLSRRDLAALGLPDSFGASEQCPSLVADAAVAMECSEGHLRGFGLAPSK